MRYFLIILLFASCQSQLKYKPVTVYDTLYVTQSCDSMDRVCDSLINEIKVSCIALDAENDSLKKELFVSNYKIGRVKYYLNICLRNPSQDKFLKGWVRRAVE